MKRVSFLAALLLLFSALTARAEIVASGFCGEDPNPDNDIVEYGENLSWSLTSDGVLTISGSGSMYDYEDPYSVDNMNDISLAPWADYKKLDDYWLEERTIKKVIISDGVTSIGSNAFSMCAILTEVTIPSSVTEIGKGAFSGCYALTEVTIPSSVTVIGGGAFSGCSGLAEVTIPSSVTVIGSEAFFNCDGLTEVTIPENVDSIGRDVFKDCNNLVTLNYNAIDCKIVGIGWNNITTLNIGEKAKVLSSNVLRDFYNLKTLNYNAADCKITMSGGYNFESAWSSITTLNIGSTVRVIPDSAFYGCDGLTEVTIPESVAEIGLRAFYGCDNIRTLNYNAADCKITMSGGYNTYPDWRGITALNIGSTVKVIPDYAFSGCSRLASVSIPESVTAIPPAAHRLTGSFSQRASPPSAQRLSVAAHPFRV